MVSLIVLVGWCSAISAPTALDIPFEKYTLPQNGLEVILSEDHSLPIVAVNLWYHAGPINEPPDRTGFAHLFEHLMFQGSKHVKDDQHIAIIESQGGSSINATTSNDRTNYYETVPAHLWQLPLWLESDRMGFLLDSLTQEKLDTQREVVLNERRQRYDNAPYGPSYEQTMQLMFPAGHPYHGCIIGSVEDLRAATLEDVGNFYRRYYAPANATLVVAGDFNPEALKKDIDRYFGSLPARPAPEPVQAVVPTLGEKRHIEVREPVALSRITWAWHSPPFFQPGDADADVLAHVLGGSAASRLHQKLVYEQALAQDVSVYQHSMALGSVFSVTATARREVSLAQLTTALESALTDMRARPPSEMEVARARNTLKTQMMLQLQNLGGGAGRADALNRYNQYLGDPGGLIQDVARYSVVTPTSVHALAQQLLDPAQRAEVVTVPK